MDDLKKRVAKLNGDPDCLHCQLGVLIYDFCENHPVGRVNAITRLEVLGQVLGDIVLHAPLEARVAAFNTVIQSMAEHTGMAVKTRGPAGEPAEILVAAAGTAN